MSVRMMISGEIALTKLAAGADNVEIIRDYPGHEAGRFNHGYDCPHRDKETGEDAIRHDDCKGCWMTGALYMETTYVGRVLRDWERNGYDDSDFYVTVWDDELDAPRSFCYASTRGWSYPNGASIDATPEIRAKYDAYLRACEERTRRERELREAKIEAHTASKGKRVRVVSGRKVPLGTEGYVFWRTDDDGYGRAKIGFRDANNVAHFTAESNVLIEAEDDNWIKAKGGEMRREEDRVRRMLNSHGVPY